jgi:hypothetical protein
VLADQLGNLAFVFNRNSLRVIASGQLRRVLTPGNIRDLGGGKGYHFIIRLIFPEDVEIMEVATGGTHDYYLAFLIPDCHISLLSLTFEAFRLSNTLHDRLIGSLFHYFGGNLKEA